MDQTQTVKVDLSAIGIGDMVSFLIKFWIASLIAAALPAMVGGGLWIIGMILTN